MALHHKTLEAAFNKYSPLVADGKNEDEVKAEISKDEKRFDEAAINEIYLALTAVQEPQPEKEQDPEAEPEPEKKGVYLVISPFRDKDNFSIAYNIDDDVSHFDEERLQDTIGKGLVEKK